MVWFSRFTLIWSPSSVHGFPFPAISLHLLTKVRTDFANGEAESQGLAGRKVLWSIPSNWSFHRTSFVKVFYCTILPNPLVHGLSEGAEISPCYSVNWLTQINLWLFIFSKWWAFFAHLLFSAIFHNETYFMLEPITFWCYTTEVIVQSL